MNEILIGNKIVLRKARLDDLDDIYQNVWQDYQIAKFMYWKITDNYNDAIDRLNRTINYQKDNQYAYFVALKESDEVIGFAGIKNTYPDVYEESGICVARKYQHLGIGNEILDLLLDLAFSKLNAKEFIYACMEDNYISKSMCLKHSFRLYKKTHEVRSYDGKEFTNEFYSLTKERYFQMKDDNIEFRLVRNDEFEMLMNVMNIAFNFKEPVKQFEHILPKLYYKDNKNMLHIGAFVKEKLVASIGLYKDTIFKENQQLEIACVGAVSTLPEYRNRGLFTTILNLIVNKAKSMGLALLFLGGRRDRYNHFGFENAGRTLLAFASKEKVKINENYIIKKIEKNDKEIIEKCLELYHKEENHANRNIDNMFAYMSSWNCKSYAVFVKDCFIGYYCQNEDLEIFEFEAIKDKETNLLKAILTLNEKATIFLPLKYLNNKQLVSLFDRYEIIFNHMVNILDYEKVAKYFNFKDNYQEILKDYDELNKIQMALGYEKQDSIVGDNIYIFPNDAG